ncbi:MAG: hypothetical protein PHD80_01660, partial [Candidatus ainarchaeum sp.]|nr:hypothetical protein [Candidatus ainarchaeum sp.]
NRLLDTRKDLFDRNIFFFEKNSLEQKSFCNMFSSYKGHFKHANSFTLIKELNKEFPFTRLCC